MNERDVIDYVDSMIQAAGALPGRMVFTRYESPADMAVPGEAVTQGDWEKQQDITLAVACEFQRRGVDVHIVAFDSASYHRWRGPRTDTRDHRAAWASLQIPDLSE